MHNLFASKQPEKSSQETKGLTLTETLLTVVIASILSSIALPTYLDQRSRACQGVPENAIQQAMGGAQAHQDEFGSAAKSWKDINKMTTIMTTSGPAKEDNFEWINLPTCDYKLKAQNQGGEYTFTATKKNAIIPADSNNEEIINPTKNGHNVIGCLNINTGASDIRKGNGSTEANEASLTCG